MRPDSWQRARAVPGHPLAALEGVVVGTDVTLETWLGPRNSVGAWYFRIHLVTPRTRTAEPVVFGLQNSGAYPGFCWVEVIEYRQAVAVADGDAVEVPDGIERNIFGALAGLVPPGGHFMAEYESPSRAATAQALALRIPPLATPLGALLAEVGCGAAFRDWYIAEGGREGPRKLQGFRALDAAHEARRAREQLAALEAYLADARDIDWGVQSIARPLAQAAVTRLRAARGV